MHTGIQNPRVIDFVGYNPEADTVSIVMVEERKWVASEERLEELQHKVNNYLSFVLDGKFAKLYPEYKDKAIVFQLDCSWPLDPESSRFLQRVALGLADYGIAWRVKLL
jgi:hypothetical protein